MVWLSHYLLGIRLARRYVRLANHGRYCFADASTTLRPDYDEFAVNLPKGYPSGAFPGADISPAQSPIPSHLIPSPILKAWGNNTVQDGWP